jgi:hypothetical protein
MGYKNKARREGRALEEGKRARALLLGLGDLGLDGGIATLVVSEAAFLFDVLVELLSHGFE